MNTVMNSIREAAKHGLSIVLFTLLLLGMMGAALGIFSAGLSALTTHGSPTSGLSVVSTVAPTTSQSRGPSAGTQQNSQGTQQSAPLSQQSSQSTQQSGQNAQQAGGVKQGVPSTAGGQDLASRLNEQLRQMQSPVTGRLDSGGVALGNQVQNAFGHFLSDLLQTLFVEQANGGSTTTQNP